MGGFNLPNLPGWLWAVIIIGIFLFMRSRKHKK